MPELPEVETVRRGLKKYFANEKIQQVKLLYPKLLVTDEKQFLKRVTGSIVTRIDRRGKFLLIRLDNQSTIVSHLRMEGRYSVEESDQAPHKHTEAIFQLVNGNQVFYDDTRKFGRMQLVKTGDEAKAVKSIGSMGPEPTEQTLTSTYFFNRLQKSKKAVKAWLLDQNNLAGIGNIYADEVLWLSRISPLRPANEINSTEADNLRENIISELAFAIKNGGSTVHSFIDPAGESGHMQDKLHVYGRVGQSCERDGEKLIKIKLAQRGTTYCQKCQK
ncbi:bifunctional DNA-formamidopyrimidine glycosylase/DNA-(apurinic or apyrimidinic site) lyase [Oenococcus sicerae]|uniref:Formamidopyrimidine-DNA glycosylase n=1 Tax=Oenococcus sicerae TaxID=2203724 RepID=A0ABX5QMR8_9LACO|nr:bifunctional DNA-formamidopyrimidine glycosylase/DNA-(apurinic or apyrimidinic site) lyase [Oenococcus sicerae]QAS70113.1 bifunctional DNA-formamidopyrimidine glycosylase/DNA-(apurinic or apyrimidinic site) lyase [Oenococcus sicerae]VDK13684.1 Formamidopyrimidine-DNA glycosylase [Oenococcus sicerae]